MDADPYSWMDHPSVYFRRVSSRPACRRCDRNTTALWSALDDAIDQEPSDQRLERRGSRRAGSGLEPWPIFVRRWHPGHQSKPHGTGDASHRVGARAPAAATSPGCRIFSAKPGSRVVAQSFKSGYRTLEVAWNPKLRGESRWVVSQAFRVPRRTRAILPTASLTCLRSLSTMSWATKPLTTTASPCGKCATCICRWACPSTRATTPTLGRPLGETPWPFFRTPPP